MLEDFDYRVECEDFILYELARLIDEDLASLENEDFRRVIDEGIHEHVERRLEIRARLAEQFRKQGATPPRVLRTIEDIESSLRDVPAIVQTYTSYLFRRLEECADRKDVVGPIADRLFDSLDDRAATAATLDELGRLRSPVSARILAHLVSEPMLDEDLETKAYALLRSMWPLPRHYILYSLKPHEHEDIPFRWFQLLVDSDEASAVDRILEEVVVHGDDPNFREDLIAVIGLLKNAGDPDTDDKIMQVLNSGEISAAAVGILEGFVKNTETQRPKGTKGPWNELERLYAANKKYLAAAKLFDEGRKGDAAQKLDELLRQEPQYPFALMLKRAL